MGKRDRLRDLLLMVAGALVCLMLRGDPRVADASSPNPGNAPFASAVQQRNETITELRMLNQLMSEQTRFLKSGKLKVVIELRDARQKKP